MAFDGWIIALADADDVECPPDGPTCMTFRYENLDLEQVSLLYVCDGKVSFQTQRLCTRWHGFMVEDNAGGMQLYFDCRGRHGYEKTHRLFKQRDGVHPVWSGHDYAVRAIRVTLLSKKRWCETYFLWNVLL